MRRFALGVLRLKPDEFGRMMVGDFLDAVRGFNEEKTSHYKLQADLTRTAVTLLVHVQQKLEDRISAEEMWKFPWDKDSEKDKTEEITPQEIEQHLKKAENFFKNNT